eukprot:TRINITY_DN5034_c0_g1_i1.p1 TRINITY_DN5034_c0_g1~~TRINITY_DN5034_c0_g1_i1.p1  ORF type:complete len:756 (+),score=198.87 TRINITY_DN5034_c0_g1_i1:275-2542(+)
MDFVGDEERDGIRLSWNVWPSSRIEATRAVVPVGALYQPYKATAGAIQVPYQPVACARCECVLNPYCSVDFVARLFVCPMCFHRNQFPHNYSDISPQTLPAELMPQFTTLEYVLPQQQAPPPIFLFVVDTCMVESELQAVKESLLSSLSNLPEKSLVGLITFGTTVQVYELAFESCPKSYVFNGNRNLDAKKVQELLGLAYTASDGPGTRPGMAPQATQRPRFVMPLEDCETILESVFEELQRDPYPVKNDRRALRCTGVAVSVAVGLMETYPSSGGRVMVFMSGPCTVGPGLVVGDELSDTIRSHHDLQNDCAKHAKKATKHYAALAPRLAKVGHALDIFACSGDQNGLTEMQSLIRATGGVTVQADSFETPMFKESFMKLFQRDAKGDVKMGFSASIEVQTSRELKCCGAIGHVSSLGKKGASVAETEIGIGNTCAWRLCSLDPNSTIAFYFEIVNQHSNPLRPGTKGLVQFMVTYQNTLGQRIKRVTTISKDFAIDPQRSLEMLGYGFDQEAAAVLMARIAVHKSENEETFDILRWLDRMLIRLVQKFGQYRKDDPSSFSLAPNFSIYPQFMFHLRRGSLLHVFNCSPDETAYYRFMLNRENVANSLLMIQPTLEAYSFDGPPQMVHLSARSVTKERILLLDTFFHVVVHYGETLADWRDKGFQHQESYANFAQLLTAPKADADLILAERFPLPRYVECDQGTSPARFLLAVLDPAITHESMGGQQGGEVIFTEDVNFQVFMEHLRKLSVQS